MRAKKAQAKLMQKAKLPFVTKNVNKKVGKKLKQKKNNQRKNRKKMDPSFMKIKKLIIVKEEEAQLWGKKVLSSKTKMMLKKQSHALVKNG